MCLGIVGGDGEQYRYCWVTATHNSETIDEILPMEGFGIDEKWEFRSRTHGDQLAVSSLAPARSHRQHPSLVDL